MPWLGELRFGLRTLAKNPGFTAVAITMLALGIGVNATVFTVASAVLFKGFPLVKQNNRLLYISNGGCCISYPDFEDIRAQAKSFQGMGITHGISAALTDGSGFAERLDITEISADTFPTAGVQPILGRQFTPADQNPGAPAVAMLNYGFWQRRYAKDPAAVGRTVRLNGIPTTIVGIMPEGFSFPQKAEMWVPLVETAAVKNRGNIVHLVRVRTPARWRLVPQRPRGNRRHHSTAGDRVPAHRSAPASCRERLHGILSGRQSGPNLRGHVGRGRIRAVDRLRQSGESAAGACDWHDRAKFQCASRSAPGAGGLCGSVSSRACCFASAGGFLGWFIAQWGVRTYALAMYSKASWLILDYTMDHRVLGYLIADFGLEPALCLAWRPRCGSRSSM